MNKELKLHRGAHNSKELIDDNGKNYVAHVMKEDCADEIVLKVNGYPRLLEALQEVDDWFEQLQGTDTNDPLWMMRKRAHQVPRKIIADALSTSEQQVTS